MVMEKQVKTANISIPAKNRDDVQVEDIEDGIVLLETSFHNGKKPGESFFFLWTLFITCGWNREWGFERTSFLPNHSLPIDGCSFSSVYLTRNLLFEDFTRDILTSLSEVIICTALVRRTSSKFKRSKYSAWNPSKPMTTIC